MDGRPPGRPRVSSGLVGPLLPILAGLAALGVGAVVLRSFGTGYRVGRLLAGTPLVSFEEADRLASGGPERYVRIEGRLDAAEDFPDENERPLVFRRERLETQRGGRWATIQEGRRLVPFEVRDGLAVVRVDAERLDEGLVVLPRESVGVAGDVPERVPPELPASTPVRFRVEQVSAVEHASVLGVVRRGTDGGPVIGPGLGRPLILSTVEPVEAMQLLAGGRRTRPLVAMVLLVAGLVLLAIGLGWAVLDVVGVALAPGPVLAASPDPSAAPVGDTRSSGEGAGLVGAPLAALAAVGLIAVASVAVTFVYLRLTRPPTAD
jgi:hypothetical protein